MTIKDIENRAGLPRANVRFYEKEGFFTPVRGENGYREYSLEDLRLLEKIKLLRQLRIPLDEIHRLHAGQSDLAQVLAARLELLGQERASLDRQAAVCAEIRADGASFPELDADKYLRRFDDPLIADHSFLRSDRLELPKADCPWRRFFARSLDMALYELIWYLVAYLVFHWNIAGLWFLDTLIVFGLMLFIEPILLAGLGTTPGKALFGIRITNLGGEKLTPIQSYSRAWAVFGRGQGYGVIPIYNLVRLYKSYHVCKERGEMEWDEAFLYTVKERRVWRPLVYIVCALIVSAAAALSPLAADMPKYRGELTAQQFSDNMNRAFAFHGAVGAIIGEGSDGGHFEAVGNERPGGPWTPPPTLSLTETDGTLTEVVLEFTGENYFNSPSWVYCAVNSYVGAQPGMNLFRMHFGEIPARLSGAILDSFSFTVAGVEVTYNVEIDGQPMSDRSDFLSSVGAGDAADLNIYFTMKLV